MSTIWDQAVRALRPVFDETGPDGRALAYYCGGRGSESFCTHRTCMAVAALAGAQLLDYHPTEVMGLAMEVLADAYKVLDEKRKLEGGPDA